MTTADTWVVIGTEVWRKIEGHGWRREEPSPMWAHGSSTAGLDRIAELEAELEQLRSFLDWLAEHQASPCCRLGGFGVPKDKLGCITWYYDADWVEVPEEFVELAQRWQEQGRE